MGVTCALLIVYGTGCILGPLISSFSMESFGPNALFLFISILCACFVVIGMWRVIHTRPTPEEEQSDYLPLPRATSLAFYLDPRNEIEEDELDEADELYPFSEEYEEEEEGEE